MRAKKILERFKFYRIWVKPNSRIVRHIVNILDLHIMYSISYYVRTYNRGVQVTNEL
jgi:hypothetical protein